MRSLCCRPSRRSHLASWLICLWPARPTRSPQPLPRQNQKPVPAWLLAELSPLVRRGSYRPRVCAAASKLLDTTTTPRHHHATRRKMPHTASGHFPRRYCLNHSPGRSCRRQILRGQIQSHCPCRFSAPADFGAHRFSIFWCLQILAHADTAQRFLSPRGSGVTRGQHCEQCAQSTGRRRSPR